MESFPTRWVSSWVTSWAKQPIWPIRLRLPFSLAQRSTSLFIIEDIYGERFPIRHRRSDVCEWPTSGMDRLHNDRITDNEEPGDSQLFDTARPVYPFCSPPLRRLPYSHTPVVYWTIMTKTIIVDDTSPSISYRGAWSIIQNLAPNSNEYNGTLRKADQNGLTAQYTFIGT